MIRLLLITLSLLVLQTCESKTIDPNTVEGKLAASIKMKCGTSSICRVRIRDVTTFDWDKMCVFKYSATREEIQKVVRVHPPEYHEFQRRIIFLSREKIVYSEENPTDVERPINGEVVFDIPQAGTHECYDQDPTFSVSIKSLEKGAYYQLKLVPLDR